MRNNPKNPKLEGGKPHQIDPGLFTMSGMDPGVPKYGQNPM